VTNSPSLSNLLLEYFQENFSKPDFPKDTKFHIARIVDLANLEKDKVKNFLSDAI
jgi:hypothetical protein